MGLGTLKIVGKTLKGSMDDAFEKFTTGGGSTGRNKKITIPGQSKLHYSPGIPIKLNTMKPKPNEAFILINKRKKSYKNYYYLCKNKNLKQAAKNLYRILRVIKNKNYKSIVVEKIPNIGFGEAINDRLKRASAK